MTDLVRDSYDAVAEQYASLFLNELDRDAQSCEWLGKFAKLAARQTGPVADLGCGPGHVTNHLSGLGLTVTGYDISPGQVAQARKAFPDLPFHIGDLTRLDDADSSLGGIISRHSLIHMRPEQFDGVFREWMRALQPGAPVFVSFYGSRSADAHGTPFDHKAATAFELFPAAIAEQLHAAGFVNVEIETNPIPEGGRPFDHATILACKPSPDAAD